jgi:ribosome-associated heat shock protein Hsp15
MMRARTDCAGLVALGSIRINRQPTGKPHAKLRVGDVLTIPLHGTVRVLRVVSLATRRGPSREARLLYVDVSDGNVAHRDGIDEDASDVSATSCIVASSPAYRGV